jgi:hypothetical protein
MQDAGKLLWRNSGRDEAMVMAVGKLSATSRANVGPESIAAGVCAEKGLGDYVMQ